MLVDARTISANERIAGDVCVVGAGPAGLAVALELERAGIGVLLLAGSAALPPGEVEGQPYPPLESTRAGALGGTAALWDAELAPATFGARYAPLAEIDFEDRGDWSGGSWPFRRDVLEPHYANAHELCDAGPYDYAAPDDAIPLGVEVAAGIFRFGASTAFTETNRRRVEVSEHIRVLADAVATRIERDGSRVVSIEAASAPDRRFSVVADRYVLAAGGIENPRLLLASGIGDERVLGRGFMDHPTIRCRLDITGAAEFGFLDTNIDAGSPVLGRLELSASTMRSEGLLNGGFFFVPARDRELRAANAARELVAGARRRRLPPSPVRRAAEAGLGADALAYTAHRRLAAGRPLLEPTLRAWPRSRLLNTLGVGPVSGWSARRRRPRAYDVYHVIEQTPDLDRRVTLSANRDAFGVPLPHLHWFVGDRELASAERAQAIMARALADAGIGCLVAAAEPVHPSAHHHLGATRMSSDSARGVVDPDGKVHGVANLFVTGGSVFPTSGFVNPTLTIVALALRLGAHLREDRSS